MHAAVNSWGLAAGLCVDAVHSVLACACLGVCVRGGVRVCVCACTGRMLMTGSLALTPGHYTHVHTNRSTQAP